MAAISLGSVVEIILEKSADALLRKLNRKEAVRKIVSHVFKSDPPSDDFEAIYIQTLIEYGVFKPEPILNFFRNEFIYKAFKQSFTKNDLTMLFREAEGIIEWNKETNKLGQIDYDPRREFATFSAVFNEIVDRTRPPSDIKRDNKLDLLNAQIQYVIKRINNLSDSDVQKTENILSRLERIENFTALRLELTRILPESDRNSDANILNRLSAQLRGWFETLNYKFEGYENYSLQSFEWIINIPKRRGYDRVLVRGVEGEIGVAHVREIRASIDKKKVDEGWLISLRRISPSARQEAEENTNSKVFCYTFDELLDENADFSGYFNWLEAEVIRLGIDKTYVPLEALNFEFDKETKQKIGLNKYIRSQGGVDRYVDKWLSDPSREHLSILGEFGTGKTWFAMHYAWTAYKKYQEAKSQGQERPRIPLVISLRDYAKAVSVESLFSEFFFRKYEIPLPGYTAFEQLNRMGKLLLIFDGFDEMADRVDKQKMINNFWELTRVVVPGAKVILTCRTEHFPTAQVGRELLRAELKASTAKLSGEAPQFEVLELEKFNKEQIREVLSYKAKPATVQKIMNFPQLLDLARRPVMTELILEAMPDIEAGKPIDLSRVYLYAVRRKIEEDIKSERTFTSIADKIYFLCEISWEMLTTNKMSINYRQFPSRLQNLFGSFLTEQQDIDHWQYDMMGQTMLIRNDDGDYAPAHRSLLEFFVAYKLSAEMGLLADDFTEIARARSKDDLDNDVNSINYSWSSYFKRETDENGDIVKVPRLEKFIVEDNEKLTLTLGSNPINKAVLDLMENMLGPNNEYIKDKLFELAKMTVDSNKKYGLIGGNVITILCHLDTSALVGKKLSGADLRYARFTNTDFSNGDFSKTNFESAEFRGAVLENSDFRYADLTNAQFIEMGEIFSVGFNKNDSLLASGGIDTNIRIWEVETGIPISTLKGHENSIRGFVWGNLASALISLGDDAIIEWDVHEKKAFNSYKNYNGELHGLSLSPNENKFLAVFSDGSLILYSFEEIKNNIQITSQIDKVELMYGNRVYAGTFGINEKTIIYYGSPGILWTLTDEQTDPKDELYLYKEITSMQINPNRKNVVMVGDIFALLETFQFEIIWKKRGNSAHNPIFSTDGEWLYCICNNKEIEITHVRTGKAIFTIDSPAPINAICVNTNNTLLVSGHNDATIRFWDARPFIDKNDSPTINLSEYLPVTTLLEVDNKIPEWWLASKPEIPNFYYPNPNFGKCIRTIEIKLNCNRMKINNAIGLNSVSLNSKQTLQEWLVYRGAIA